VTVPAWDETLLPTPTDAKAIESESQVAHRRVAELEQQTVADRQTIEQIQIELLAIPIGQNPSRTDHRAAAGRTQGPAGDNRARQS
jgi:hypothetical protein